MQPPTPRSPKPVARPLEANANPPVTGAEFLLSMVEERCAASNGNGRHRDSRGEQELKKMVQQTPKPQAAAKDDGPRREIEELRQRIDTLRNQVSSHSRAWEKAE